MNIEQQLLSYAGFDEFGTHRFYLCRSWDRTKPAVMFIGLNPSKADAENDDPTIRRVKSMAKNWGYGTVYMMNLFTFISTNPDELDILGGNDSLADDYLKVIAKKCDKIIFAWGNFNVYGRDEVIKKMFPDAYALHINKNGSPKHPLYVKGDVVPVKYIY